ncbi:beta-1,3-glucanase family protein [Kitasatospora sp. NPDC093679]|uniref:beta-1,3-glucanase family protein n=1 Tax=Kitasatospora sp. NPDC093679 TaxID=3154983 RepID=UPI003422F681
MPDTIPLTPTNQSGLADQVFIYDLGTELSTGRQGWADATGTFHPWPGGAVPPVPAPDAAIAGPANGQSITLRIPKFSGRIYFSYGRKLDFRLATGGRSACGAEPHGPEPGHPLQLVRLAERLRHLAGGDVVVDAEGARLGGQLALPEEAKGIVLFAHGSGSSRHSPRNRFVARALNRAGPATLLFDLLTEDEELDRANVFDTALLARRLTDATRWLPGRPEARGLAVGYFGASTGAAAALRAASEPDSPAAAVVSRGGRPDLAGARLPGVTAPTLLIVGGLDDVVIDLNRQAQARLRCENRLTVVPGATHPFEEPGALEEVADLVTRWFTSHLLPAPHAAA